MKVAVTGASGFLGRHVLERLLCRRDLRIVASSRSKPAALPEGLAGLAWVPMDMADASEQSFVRLGEPDVLIHMAWGGLPRYRSLHHYEVELGLQYRFLAALLRAGLARLVCTGTCFEYGMRFGPQHESDVPDPGNPYGLAKHVLRRQLDFLNGEKSFSLLWARLFYLYGPGQAPSSLYCQLHAAIERGDAAFPMSGGEQLRDFLPVTEAAESIVQLALDSGAEGLVNICSGQPVSVRSLVERWRDEARASLVLERGRFPYPNHEPLAFWGSRERLDALLRRADLTAGSAAS